MLIFLACFFICASSFAQQYPFVHYTPKDGLVNSRVKKAYQDSKGRMYFLTYGGLSVYDGVRFRNYTTFDGLGSTLVNDIIEVGEDSILIATNTGILNKLVKGKISRLNTENNFCPVINYFYRHNNGSIYLSSDQGLFRLDNNRILQLNTLLLNKDSTKLVFLGNISGSGNFLFICTDDLMGYEGLYLYDISNNRICDSLPGKYIQPIGKNKKNQVWISTLEKIYVLDSTSLSQGKLELQVPATQSDFKDMFVSGIVVTNNNIREFYSENPFSITKLYNKVSRSVPGVLIPEEILSSDIRYLFVDRENSFWICSNASGVFKMIQSSLQIFENPVSKSLKTSIYAAYCSPYGTWYSSNKELLYKKTDTDLKEFKGNLHLSPTIFFADNNKIIGNDEKNVFEAAITPSKNILNFRKIISLSDTTSFTSRRIVDKYGAIIAGVKGGLGVWRNNKLIFFFSLSQIDLAEGLLFDKNNFLWMITRFSGIKIFRLHPETPSEYLETIHYLDEIQISGSPRCMEFDKQGSVWVGTRENGLFKYKQESNQLKELAHFTTGNGLTDNFVVSLACDSSNNIMAGTQTGLDRIFQTPDGNYQVENLSKTKNYFGYISDVWVDADGQGYARTFSGSLLTILPGQISKSKYIPQLLLEEMRVNAVIGIKKKSFAYNQNNLSFAVAAPSFINERQVRYSYLLEGSGNKHWTDTTFSNADINLTNLSPGRYTLQVKAFFPSDMYPPAQLSYPFEITPPWWQTWWFRSSAGLLVIGLLIMSIRFYYRRKLEKGRAVLEKQQAIEKERSRIATDMHDDLGAGLSSIHFLSEKVKRNVFSDVTKNDIEKMQLASSELMEKMNEIIWAMSEKNDSFEDLLFYTRSYSKEYCEENNLDCNIRLPENIPAIFVRGEIRRNVFLTVKESLHNIVKHAEAQKVTIDVNINSNLEIKIKDDGKGLSGSQKGSTGGNGLRNMQKRIASIGGTIEINTERGFTVTLKVPLASG